MSSPDGHKQPQWPAPPPPPQRPASSSSAARPQLLPPFEPLSSSPTLPRPPKRKFQESPTRPDTQSKHYPTPVPTSSTAQPPTSSPPAQTATSTRPGLTRTVSSLSERAPLAAVPFLTLPANGEFVLMGRSSNSSHYQLSANRLISRVHVRAAYLAATSDQEAPSVLVECLGWNGAKVHCRGQVFELGKGHTFTSDKVQSDIMLDVQDARVLIRWPSLHRTESVAALSDATWEEDASPKRALTPAVDPFDSSPPHGHAHLRSPVSPSPRGRLAPTASSTFLGLPPSSSTRPSVQIYEDNSASDSPAPEPANSSPNAVEPEIKPDPPAAASSSQISHTSSLLSDPISEYSDQDEENDPIIHSFGVFGDSLLPRMASINATSPERKRQPLQASVSPYQGKSFEDGEVSLIRNHVINQLAFSRLHALPISTILRNLPGSLKGDNSDPLDTNSEQLLNRKLTEEDLKKILDETACIGEIARQGKDAAGKPLEDEFYYLAELDADEGRRNAVENSLGKPGLRAVRKQHKQYYWKRPRH